MTEYEHKLKNKTRIVFWLGVVLVVMLLVKVAVFILRYKFKITLPVWLDILL